MYKKLIFLVLLIACSIPSLFGQFCANPPACLTNGNLEPDVATAVGDMNSGGGTNVNSWGVSHGTPTLVNGFTARGIWMWGRTSGGVAHGEGIFACYNFQQGHEYQICFRAMNTSTNNSGNLFVRAVSGLATTPGNSVIPAVPGSSQIIHNGHVHTNNWQQYSVTFVPNTNYNGIWVYPFSAFDFINGIQYEVAVDDIWVNEAQPNNLTVTASPGTIGSCSSSTLSVNNALAGSTYLWWPATGLSSTTGSSVIARPCSTTTYTVEIRNPCMNSPCLPFIQRQVTVTVQPGISVTASPSTIDICQGSTLTASSSDPMNVTWSPSTGLSSTSGNVVTANPCSTTTYTATFFCPQSGCTYTDAVTVNVQPNGGIVNNSSTACGGNIDLLYVPNTPCPGLSYSWTGPKPGVLSTSANYTKPVSTPGDVGVYTLTVTTAQGCTTQYYTSVVMNCCSVLADFDIIDCNPVRFENKTVDGNGNPVLVGEWFWDLGDGTTSSIRNPSHLYNTLGTTTVCLTAVITDPATLSTCCQKVCKDFKVCDWGPICQKAAFDYKVTNPAIGEVQFIDQSTGTFMVCTSGTPYTWKVNGVIVSTSQTPSPVVLGGSGTYNVCLEVQYCWPNGQTCTDIWCEDIVIP